MVQQEFIRPMGDNISATGNQCRWQLNVIAISVHDVLILSNSSKKKLLRNCLKAFVFFCDFSQNLLFNPSKPFSRGSQPADVDLMIDCLVSCFRISPHNNQHFKVRALVFIPLCLLMLSIFYKCEKTRKMNVTPLLVFLNIVY